MSRGAEAAGGVLAELADQVRGQGEPLAGLVSEKPAHPPDLGALVAAGTRAEADPAAYAFVVESVREGFLLHYGESRLLATADPDLALLAGDLLYALGIERLSALGDPESVDLLSDLIRGAAELHAADRAAAAELYWIERIVALAWGLDPAAEDLRHRLAKGDREAFGPLLERLRATADGHGEGRAFDSAVNAIHLPPSEYPSIG